VHDYELDLTIAFDPATMLPHTIRSFEDHAIFGPTTSDIRLFNYTEVKGMQVPGHRLVLYNGTSVVEETIFSNVILNPEFSNDYFDGLGINETATPRVSPAKIPGYSHAELGEFWSNGIWQTEYTGTFDNITVGKPAADLPNVYQLAVMDSPAIEHLILDFQDGVIVYEAPPHQTDLIIRWVRETLKKPITHVFVSVHFQ
jgi:hypothetical protein